GLPMAIVAAFSIVMTIGAEFHLLPPPRPSVDMDRTILTHQADMAGTAPAADALLLGDSSCLIDIRATALEQSTKRRVLNLGTLSYLSFDGFALLLREYAGTHASSKPATVVILLHPSSLRRHESEAYFLKSLEAFLAGEDFCTGKALSSQPLCRLGFYAFRDRLLTRWLGWPLPQEYATRYGFTTHLWKRMTQDKGSVQTSGLYVYEKGQGSAEYHVSSGAKNLSRFFRQRLPKGYRLAIGLTPIPASFALPDYDATRMELLQQWTEAIGADAVLSSLPATLPDALFASTTHLNDKGAKVFTDQLSTALRKASNP
ncbi:MAG: hypothetical protein V2A34_02690, partial [Lentisphaerota bacterium]